MYSMKGGGGGEKVVKLMIPIRCKNFGEQWRKSSKLRTRISSLYSVLIVLVAL